jgi:hypothetical protein
MDFNSVTYPDQKPLGTQFKSYELTEAQNFWTLDPYQYSITKFKYSLPGGIPNESGNEGLMYKNIDFEKLLPSFTGTKRSVNDFPAQSYHRFLANDGYFNPKESLDNSDLWYYGADAIARQTDALAGAPLNVQEINHIVFPEPQRGGLDTRNLTKYSSTPQTVNGNTSWESENYIPVNNDTNCVFFNYNSRNTRPTQLDKVYSFDSNYCRDIRIAGPYEGSMPFNPKSIS